MAKRLYIYGLLPVVGTMILGLFGTASCGASDYAKRWAAAQETSELEALDEARQAIWADIRKELVGAMKSHVQSSYLYDWLLRVMPVLEVEGAPFFTPIDEKLLRIAAVKQQHKGGALKLTQAEEQAALAMQVLSQRAKPAKSPKSKLGKKYQAIAGKERFKGDTLSWLNNYCATLAHLSEATDSEQPGGGFRTELGRLFACIACGRFFGTYGQERACNVICGSLQWGSSTEHGPCPVALVGAGQG